MSGGLLRTILLFITDIAWIFWGAVAWLLTLGSATVEVENYATNHKFKFPGWFPGWKF